MKKPKTYRKSIRINEIEVKSPRFRKSADAEKWYEAKLREKQYSKEGINLPVDDKTTLREYFENPKNGWFKKRKDKYPMATYASDEQRYYKYVDPDLGKLKPSRISQLQVRLCLAKVVDVYKQSANTRNKVRSLLSKIFNDAMNENPPLVINNPALGISFVEARKGKKTPPHLRQMKEILKFIKVAKKLGPTHYAYACIFLMAGVRKSEGIAFRWDDFNADEAELRIDEKFEQASMTIKSGTKAGSDEHRIVAIPDDLVNVLEAHRKKSDFQGEEDFILCSEDGGFIPPKKLHNLHMEIVIASGIEITPHGLRHTFGRQFMVNGGNMKALQSILGHSNSATTDLYSQLAGKAIKKHRNTANLGLGDNEDA